MFYLNTTSELQRYFCPFGYLDLERACAIGNIIWYSEYQLFEVIDNFKEDLGFKDYENIDPVYCILEHILQMARNKIEELTGYDFIDNLSYGNVEIYVHWNFMCSSYDYSEEAIEELRSKVKPQLHRLLEDNLCKYFLNEISI